MLTGARITPHESPHTDIVLVGHSIGGVLAAEVALMRSQSFQSSEARQHRILGVLTFDTPFLGIHPGVIGTGIASLFKSSPDKPESEEPAVSSSLSPAFPSSDTVSLSNSTTSDPFSLPADDPNYNPIFQNDTLIPQRTRIENLVHFYHKHSQQTNGLRTATKNYFKSHVEFGGVLVDYPGMRNRYSHLRALEDVNELQLRRDPSGKFLRRCRFVNYYSASTGRVKTPREQSPAGSSSSLHPPTTALPSTGVNSSHSTDVSDGTTTPMTPRLSLEEHRDGTVIPKKIRPASPPPSLTELEPFVYGSSSASSSANEDISEHNITGRLAGLPPITDPPSAPPPFDATSYRRPEDAKIAQREHKRQVEAYEKSKKDREKTIRDREKLLQKREKLKTKEAAKQMRLEEKLMQKESKARRMQEEKAAKAKKKSAALEGKDTFQRSSTLNQETYDAVLAKEVKATGKTSEEIRKKQKDRKFCMLPQKDKATGMHDPTWIRVYMEGVDEVTAHTSLFFMSESYEKLVGDTAARVEEWVRDDATKRALLAEMKQGAT